jgi:hypothetical protein
MSQPNKICRILLENGSYVREDGLEISPLQVYVYPDIDNPISGEAWLYDGPLPDSLVTPPPAENA